MSFLLRGRLPADPQARPTALRRISDLPRIGGSVDPWGMLAMQRLAGNRAASTLVVQRCGPIPPDQCPCEGGSGEANGTSHESADRATTAQEDGSGPPAAIEV